MKAAIINQFGTSEVFEIRNDFPTPKIHKNQVLIKIEATSINPLDYKTREGLLKPILGSQFPMVLGNDAAGTIVKVGRDVTSFKEGDKVYAILDSNQKRNYFGFAGSGSYAEYGVSREDTLAKIPKDLSWEEAATVPLCALTAYQALIHKAKIKRGDKVLINGASGGVGLFATQIALSKGADVTAVCSSRNMSKLRELGVQKFIDYREKNIAEWKERFDILYDVVANRKFTHVKGILKKKGIFISNLAKPIFFLFPFLRKVRKFGRYSFAWVEASGKDLQAVSTLIESGKIQVVIDRSFQLEEIGKAQDYCKKGGIIGKVAIKIL